MKWVNGTDHPKQDSWEDHMRWQMEQAGRDTPQMVHAKHNEGTTACTLQIPGEHLPVLALALVLGYGRELAWA